MSTRLEWDTSGEKYYHAGVSNVVYYPQTSGGYGAGEAWNGVSDVQDKPSGAEATEFWADNILYANVMSAEKYAASLTCYHFPHGFLAANGVAEVVPGVRIGQQPRKGFGLCYRTEIGNDEDESIGYELNLVYGLKASPAEIDNKTKNDSPELREMSFEMSSTPVKVTGHKPTSILTISSLDFSAAQMEALEDVLYGSNSADATLPLPDEVAAIMGSEVYEIVLNKANVTTKLGKDVVLTAVTSPAGETVTWASGTVATATVANGVVHPVAAGTTVITASFTKGGVTYSDTCNVTVTAS